MKKFQELELDPRIKKGLFDSGLIETFPIQEKAIDPLLLKRDVIGQAKTGTGKTAAYVIPMLQTVNTEKRYVQALVLAPTRELAVQITQEIRRLGKYTNVKVVTIYGGQAANVQLEALSRGVQVVVGTPGRVIDLIDRGRLSLQDVKYVVLDEADTMLDMGFIDDVKYILDFVSPERQTSLFSATMPESIVQLADSYMNNPERILIDSDEPSVDTLDQYYTMAEEIDKLSVLISILEKVKPSTTIIFCSTKYRTNKLARELERRFFNASPINGDLSQNQRDHVMNLFRSKHLDILVATDLAGRGLDIPHVDCIINYDVPKYPLIYFHRVGRTARAGGSGKSFTIISGDEYEDFARIKKMTTAEIKPLYPNDEKYDFQINFSNEYRSSQRRYPRYNNRRYSRPENRNRYNRYQTNR
jgi:ATP-dependent RNA helicase DeaD